MSEPWADLASAAIDVLLAFGGLLIALCGVFFVAGLIWEWWQQRWWSDK